MNQSIRTLCAYNIDYRKNSLYIFILQIKYESKLHTLAHKLNLWTYLLPHLNVILESTLKFSFSCKCYLEKKIKQTRCLISILVMSFYHNNIVFFFFRNFSGSLNQICNWRDACLPLPEFVLFVALSLRIMKFIGMC